MLIFRDNGGDENWRVWSIDIETGAATALSPGDGVKAYVQQVSRHFPDEVLIAHNERGKRFFDIHRVNVATGASALVERNDGFLNLFTDQQFRARFAKRYADDGEMEYLSRDEASTWSKVIQHIPAGDSLTTWPAMTVRSCTGSIAADATPRLR